MFKESKRMAAADTLIGQGTVTEGTMFCEANLRVEGEYRGDIDCKGDVIIGECGVARSNITARDVTVAGKIIGDVMTNGRLIITSSGQLIGNITAHTLIIQDGGMINGNCSMEQAASDKNRNSTTSNKQPTQSKEASAKETKEKSRQAG